MSCMKFSLARRGVRKLLAHSPATVTDESCPSSASEVSIMSEGGAIRRSTHIWCDEHPLRQLIVIEVFVEHSKVLDLCQTVRIRGYGVVAHERTSCWLAHSCQDNEYVLVFANVIICSSFLVDVVAFEAAVWRVFLVLAPADSVGFEKVDDRLAGRADPGKAVATNSMSGTANSRDIVGLRGLERCMSVLS